MKSKILVVIDSHIGEIYQLSSMLHYWMKKGDIDEHTNLVVNVVRERITDEMILSELDWFRGNILIKRYHFVGVNRFRKIINFSLFTLGIISINRKVRLSIVPYDQKAIFYFVISTFFYSKLICIPHTTGPEIYSDDMVSNMKQKNRKKIPILIKNKASTKYYNKLGFGNIIIGGDYSSEHTYSQNLIKKLAYIPSKNCIEIVIFSLGYIEDMFSYDSWVQTHIEMFNCLSKLDDVKVFIKLHPSQCKTKFLDEFSDYINKCDIIDIHPETLSIRCDIFISILTSAGHHAINRGKAHTCYATSEMREGVKEFGNSPYPYDGFKSEEISVPNKLNDWVKESIVDKSNSTPSWDNKGSSLLTLREIENAITYF